MARLTDNFASEIRALVAAGGDDSRDALVAALADARPKVAREARKALAAGFVVPRERLLALYAGSRGRHTRTQVLALLARGERGESMVSLLEAARVSDGAMLGRVCEHLARWLEVFAPLPPGRVRQLTGAFREAERVLPAAVAGRMRAYLVALRGTPARVTPAPRKKRLRRAMAAAAGRGFLSGRVVRRRYVLAPNWLARLRGAGLG